ncbi:hypothetical protein Zm00014a_028866 [Zea mays]|uniref:Helitron helicase-like domain-containing protein n=1 Tax=Zea mays TaxID=4577 RepID=A0A317YI16_MAIZE|nr:hypothetical protein Zm00014a_028866 [Zea mays]
MDSDKHIANTKKRKKQGKIEGVYWTNNVLLKEVYHVKQQKIHSVVTLLKNTYKHSKLLIQIDHIMEPLTMNVITVKLFSGMGRELEPNNVMEQLFTTTVAKVAKLIFLRTNQDPNLYPLLQDNEGPHQDLDPAIVKDLIKMLDLHNPLAKKFRMARERLANNKNEEFIIRLIRAREGDSVQYNLPSVEELAMLVVGDFSLDTFKRDIIIEMRSKELKRISALHPSFMALQYPLLFPFGEHGFQIGIIYNGVNPSDKGT